MQKLDFTRAQQKKAREVKATRAGSESCQGGINGDGAAHADDHSCRHD